MLRLSIILLAVTASILAVKQNFLRIGNSEYLISEQKLNWFKAVHFCHSIDADLASIESALELLALSNYLKNIGKGNQDWYWFDGNDLGENAQYYSLSTGRLMAFTRWAKDEPNQVDGKQHCICLWKRDADFEMSDWECENAAYFICKPRESKCLARNRTMSTAPNTFGFLQAQLETEIRQNFEQIGDEFYYFGETNVTWHEADQLCRRRGGNLLNIESAEELEAVGNSLIAKGRDVKEGWHWIDGIDADRDGHIISLTTGKQLSFMDFDSWQPYRAPGSCVMIWKSSINYKMYELSCEAKALYICKARKPEVVNVYGSPVNTIRT